MKLISVIKARNIVRDVCSKHVESNSDAVDISAEIWEQLAQATPVEAREEKASDNVEDKARFIENLGWILAQTREGVNGATLMTKENGEEYAVIIFNDGYAKRVNIECDSYMAIIRDVTRVI